MTTLPLTLAMIAASSSATNASTSDLNQDGIVNTTDLLAVLAEINTTCRSESCATDLTGDARTTWMDLLFVMDNWGTVPPRSADDDEGHVDGPVLLDAVYYDQYSSSNWRRQLAEQLDQGEHTRSWCTTNDIKVEPIVYGGGVDQDHDGSYSDEDREVFKQWMDENVPADYTGPVCLDMEGQWWSLLSTPSQTVMDHAIEHHIEGLEYAQALLPNAKTGYWGLPRKDHTGPNSTTASIDRLILACTAIFPDVYEHNPGVNDYARLRRHIETCMEMSEGNTPVYVQASPRYKPGSQGYRWLHDINEFVNDQVRSALEATWIDKNGQEHRVAGVGMWDAYIFVKMYTEGWSGLSNDDRKELWNALDHYHVECMSQMKIAVDQAQPAHEHEQDEPWTVSGQKRTELAQAAGSAIRKHHRQQRSRLVRVLRAKRSWRSASSAYRSARSSYRKAVRSYRSAMKRAKGNSKKRRAARAALRTARNGMRKASRSYRSARSAYRSARRAQQA